MLHKYVILIFSATSLKGRCVKHNYNAMSSAAPRDIAKNKFFKKSISHKPDPVSR